MKVQSKPCNQCLFTKNRIVSKERATSIVKDSLKKDTFFVCHKSSIEGDGHGEVCCKTYWDRYKNQFNLGRIAQRLDVVKFVDVQ